MLALSKYKEPIPSKGPDPTPPDLEIGAGELPYPAPAIPRFTEDPRYANKDVAVIITCHNSQDNIKETVTSFLKHFFPNQIFITDNGSKRSDKTESIVKDIDPLINYISLRYGNKSFSQGWVLQISQNFPITLISDDDIKVGEHFKPDHHLIKGNTHAVCYPIVADGGNEWVVRCQALEYKLSDGVKYALSRHGGVNYVHGALSLWRSNTLQRILGDHPTDFIAEDLILSILMNRLKDSNGNIMKIAMSLQEPIKTLAPRSFIGTPPNLYMQRALRWELGRFAHFRYFVSNLLQSSYSSVSDWLIQKSSQLYDIYSIIADVIKIPVIVLSAGSPQFWWRFGAYMLTTNAIVGLWNIKLHRNIPGSESISTVATYSFYKTAQSILTSVSVLRLFLVYLPNYKSSPTINSLKVTGLFDEEEIIRKFQETNQLRKVPETPSSKNTPTIKDAKSSLSSDSDVEQKGIRNKDSAEDLHIQRLRRENSTGDLSKHILQIQIHSALESRTSSYRLYSPQSSSSKRSGEDKESPHSIERETSEGSKSSTEISRAHSIDDLRQHEKMQQDIRTILESMLSQPIPLARTAILPEEVKELFQKYKI